MRPIVFTVILAGLARNPMCMLFSNCVICLLNYSRPSNLFFNMLMVTHICFFWDTQYNTPSNLIFLGCGLSAVCMWCESWSWNSMWRERERCREGKEWMKCRTTQSDCEMIESQKQIQSVRANDWEGRMKEMLILTEGKKISHLPRRKIHNTHPERKRDSFWREEADFLTVHTADLTIRLQV